MEVMISFLLFLIDPVTNILHRYFLGTPGLNLGNSELVSVFVHIQLCFLWLMPKEQTKVFRQFVHFITSLLVISFILYSVYHNNREISILTAKIRGFRAILTMGISLWSAIGQLS